MVDGRPSDEDHLESGPDEDHLGRTPDERHLENGPDERHLESGPGDERSGKVVFMEALRVKRNAKWGVAAGIAFAALVFVSFPGAYSPSRSMAWYLALAFVLMLSMAGLVAFFLTLGRAVRLSRDL